MTLIQAVIMGVVQGLGEFLPISSSAHLILAPWVLNFKDPGLSFDVALHLGTLVAVLAFFWKDWLVLIFEGFRGVRTREGKMFWYLVVATVPGAVFGFLFEKDIETIFRNPMLVGILLIVMGIVLYLADKLSYAGRDLYQITLKDSILIGLSQAFALLPGVSRSGVTMTAGRFLGLDRETTARFSFLLSTPIIFGAGILKLKDMTSADFTLPFIIGVLVSAVVGFAAIKFLLRYLVRNSFSIFVVYRFLLGAAVIGLALYRG